MDWDYFKAIFQVILVPLLGIFGYHYKRHLDRLDTMDDEITNIKIENTACRTERLNIDDKFESISDQFKELKTLMNILISKLDK